MKSKTLKLMMALTALTVQNGMANETYPFPGGAPAGGIESPYQYDEVYAWCSNFVSDLQSVRWNARLEASMGALDSASQKLIYELRAKAAQIGTIPVEPAPHAVTAIRAGLFIAEELNAALAQERLSPMLAAQIKYFSFDQVYQLIEEAYFDLDQRFYRDLTDLCWNRHGGCRPNGPIGNLPSSYFDGMRKIGLSFLNFQLANSSIEASDIVELKMTRAVVHATREILNSSLARRDLSCAIISLENLERLVNQFMSYSPVPRPQQIGLVRYELAATRDLIAAARPAGCRH